MRFRDRSDGGRQLAARLGAYRDGDTLVLALPRGGVPVAVEVARALAAPLDVLVARKIGAPAQPEYAVGAIAEGGGVFIDPQAASDAGLDATALARAAEREAIELARRVELYRGGRPLPRVAGQTVLVVDDGIATGRTALAAVRALRARAPRRLVLAAPVIAAATVPALRAEVDDLVHVSAPDDFTAVGRWYDSFDQTTDEEVVALLARAGRPGEAAGGAAPGASGGRPPAHEGAVELVLPVRGGELRADVAVPAGARALVLFAHGSGSSRFSRRNRHVARRLRDAGLATALLDLLTRDEGIEDGITGELRFDVPLLADRLLAATRALGDDPRTASLPVCYFGASTGAAAALVAAAALGGGPAAVVSRGGRPDLAGVDALRRVRAPTLLVVGGEDRNVLDLNRAALAELAGERQLVVVPGATHLFEEPGALDVVADLAARWFGDHLGGMERGRAPAGRG